MTTDVQQMQQVLNQQAKAIAELKRAVTILEKRLAHTAKRADRAYESARVNRITTDALANLLNKPR